MDKVKFGDWSIYDLQVIKSVPLHDSKDIGYKYKATVVLAESCGIGESKIDMMEALIKAKDDAIYRYDKGLH